MIGSPNRSVDRPIEILQTYLDVSLAVQRESSTAEYAAKIPLLFVGQGYKVNRFNNNYGPAVNSASSYLSNFSNTAHGLGVTIALTSQVLRITMKIFLLKLIMYSMMNHHLYFQNTSFNLSR
jgi:hypothetical protein